MQKVLIWSDYPIFGVALATILQTVLCSNKRNILGPVFHKLVCFQQLPSLSAAFSLMKNNIRMYA